MAKPCKIAVTCQAYADTVRVCLFDGYYGIMIIVKSSVMDSYTMVCMVCSYLQAAPTTEITFDLYDKLCRLYSKFKSLLQKAGEAGTL